MTISTHKLGFVPFLIQPANSLDQPWNGMPGLTNGDDFEAILSSIDNGASEAGNGKVGTLQPIAAEALAALEQGIEIQSRATTYALDVDVSDRALAFQARPILAPAAVENIHNPPEPSGLATAQPDSASHTLPAQSHPGIELPNLEPQFISRPDDSRVAAAAISRSGLSPASNGGTLAGGTLFGRQAGPPLVASSQTPPAMQQEADLQRASEASRNRQSSQLPQARARLFAHLLAMATEYRVAVRGAQLTKEERDQLIMDIRSALHSHGFADLPVTLSTDTGGA